MNKLGFQAVFLVSVNQCIEQQQVNLIKLHRNISSM